MRKEKVQPPAGTRDDARRRRSSHAVAAVTYRACDTCIMRLRPADTCHMTRATRGVRRRGMPRRGAAGTREGNEKKKK